MKARLATTPRQGSAGSIAVAAHQEEGERRGRHAWLLTSQANEAGSAPDDASPSTPNVFLSIARPKPTCGGVTSMISVDAGARTPPENASPSSRRSAIRRFLIWRRRIRENGVAPKSGRGDKRGNRPIGQSGDGGAHDGPIPFAKPHARGERDKLPETPREPWRTSQAATCQRRRSRDRP